jgi:hypothetical protein
VAAKKYRPYFTLAELKVLQQSVHATISPEKRALNIYLNKFISDIEHGFRQENHTLKPSITERLGFDEPDIEQPTQTKQLTEDELIAIEEAKIFCKS